MEAFIASLPERLETARMVEDALGNLALALERAGSMGTPEATVAAAHIRNLDIPSLLAVPPICLKAMLEQLTQEVERLAKRLTHPPHRVQQ